MRHFLIAAGLIACAPAAALAQSDAPVPAATAAADASPTPRAVSRADAERPSAALVAKGRKVGSPFGYMKQANDDPQGLSRIQDQARQLRPQL